MSTRHEMSISQPRPSSRWREVRDTLWQTFYVSVWQQAWPVWAGAFALAVANILMFAYARGLGVFPQMAMWGSWIYNLLGIPTEAPFAAYPLKKPYLDLHSMLNFGIIFGVAIAALLSREFKLRREDWRGYLYGFVGGVLMGYGTVLTPPCNVGGFFTATMALSLSGPVMAAGLLGGAYLGGRFLQRQMEREVAEIDFTSLPQAKPVDHIPISRQPLVGMIVLAILFLVAGLYYRAGMSKFAGLLLFGALFGVIFQRSRICFAAAFREIFVSRDGKLMRWILLSIAVGTLGFTFIKGHGHMPDHMVLPVGIHTAVGAFIFGIGMVIAGGCGVGILWRSAEGYVRAWFALLGGMLAAGSWIHVYGRHVGEGWLYGKPVFLPNLFGWPGAVAAVFLFLGAFYLLITWVEAGRGGKA